MTLLAVERMGLAFLYGLAHPAPVVEYDEPGLPTSVRNWAQPAKWVAGELPALADTLAVHRAKARYCAGCDTAWTGEDPCFACNHQPGGTRC